MPAHKPFVPCRLACFPSPNPPFAQIRADSRFPIPRANAPPSASLRLCVSNFLPTAISRTQTPNARAQTLDARTQRVNARAQRVNARAKTPNARRQMLDARAPSIQTLEVSKTSRVFVPNARAQTPAAPIWSRTAVRGWNIALFVTNELTRPTISHSRKMLRIVKRSVSESPYFIDSSFVLLAWETGTMAFC